MYQRPSFHSVVQITNRHIFKVMLTFFSPWGLPKTTKARLVLAADQNRGPGRETENIYTAGPPKSSLFSKALCRTVSCRVSEGAECPCGTSTPLPTVSGTSANTIHQKLGGLIPREREKGTDW